MRDVDEEDEDSSSFLGFFSSEQPANAIDKPRAPIKIVRITRITPSKFKMDFSSGALPLLPSSQPHSPLSSGERWYEDANRGVNILQNSHRPQKTDKNRSLQRTRIVPDTLVL